MPQMFYRIHDANIHAMHAVGGPVYKLIDESAITAAYFARENVRSRTGKLRNSIRANRPKQEGGFSIAATVYANARHALWVHEGTPEIFPKKGKYLTVPIGHKKSTVSGGTLRRQWMGEGKNRGKKPYFLAESVSGQDANPYLADGMRESLAKDPHLGFTGAL